MIGTEAMNGGSIFLKNTINHLQDFMCQIPQDHNVIIYKYENIKFICKVYLHLLYYTLYIYYMYVCELKNLPKL
jgi:predicted nuclease of restriction endonuclease-like (RecB) superfamily